MITIHKGVKDPLLLEMNRSHQHAQSVFCFGAEKTDLPPELARSIDSFLSQLLVDFERERH